MRVQNKAILTNELFEKLILKYLDYCDNYLHSGLPENLYSHKDNKEKLNDLMTRIGIQPNQFWTKFDTMLTSKALEITTEKSFKSRKPIHHVKIH